MHLHSIGPNLACYYLVPRSTVLRLFYSILSLLYQGIMYFTFFVPITSVQSSHMEGKKPLVIYVYSVEVSCVSAFDPWQVGVWYCR